MDKYGRTSVEDIYGGGDCVRMLYRGERVCFESVYQAKKQGEIAAKFLSGFELDEALVPWFWSDQYEMKVQTIGFSKGYDEVYVREGVRGYSHWYFEGGRLLSVDSLGDTEGYQVGKYLLDRGKRVSRQELENAGDIRELMK